MAEKTENHIFIDILRELNVPYTERYSQAQFDSMPFQSLFGLSKLLERYNISSRGIHLADPSQITQLPTPFIASTGKGLIIVTYIDDGERIDYISQGKPESIPLADFVKVWPGDAFQLFPAENACEPDYAAHRRDIFFAKAKKVLLKVLVAIILIGLFIYSRAWSHISTILVTAIDLVGIYISWMLVQKSLKIHNPHADRVCGVIQAGGCDKVLETQASTFYGIFAWSEVGITYFSVSLLAFLIFPQCTPWLALLNICCLPFSFWSVWYQKFRARHWCTLCLIVQASLWALFFCYLGGGYVAEVFRHTIHATTTLQELCTMLAPPAILIAVYATVLLAINQLDNFIDKKLKQS